MTETTAHDWSAVTPAAPCDICGRDRYCSRNGTAARCTKLSSHPTHGEGIAKTDRAGNDWWLYKLGGDDRPKSTLPEPTVPQTFDETLADADTLHKVYSSLLRQIGLVAQHRLQLKRRGFSLEQILDAADRLLYRSLPLRGRAKIVAKLIAAGAEKHFPHVPGFIQKTGDDGSRYWTLAGSPGMLIPVRDIEGRIVALKIRRDDAKHGKYQWLTSRKKRDGKVCGVGPGSPLHIPLHDGTSKTVRITEGPLKADIATMLTGTLTIALPGVGAWKRAKAIVHQAGAESAVIAMDADAIRNPDVARAIEGLATELPLSGFSVTAERWNEADGKGIDDLLLGGKQPYEMGGPELQEWVSTVAEESSNVANQSSSRTPIEITADEWIAIRDTTTALGADDTLFQRQGQLVKLIRLPADELEHGIKRVKLTPKLIAAKPHYIRELITRHCYVYKEVETESGTAIRHIGPPDWLYRGIAERGHWDDIRTIAGFTEVPIMRADGSILTAPGYDPDSQIVYLCDGEPPVIPDNPTHAQAVVARDRLMDLFHDFPFASGTDRAAALSGILTKSCRDCIPGCVPMFLIESAEAGTGKGLYCGVNGIITTGREFPTMNNPTDVEETRKAITSCLIAGNSTIVLD